MGKLDFLSFLLGAVAALAFIVMASCIYDAGKAKGELVSKNACQCQTVEKR